MKRVIIATVATCLALLMAFNIYYAAWEKPPDIDVLKVGFLYENDGGSPYTYNFLIAQGALERQLDERVEVLSRSNVLVNETEEPLRELVKQGCGIIFAVTESDQVAKVAAACPQVQFCQVSQPGGAGETPSNFHTFNAQMAPARYVAGVAAGMKLREMIDAGELSADQALVGYVGAAAEPQVISGFTAFLIGVRTAAPEARMLVKYAGAWCDYSREKAAAEALIQAGCRVIANETHTIGPVVACEEAAAQRTMLLIGNDQSTLDLAPASTLVSLRSNWIPYVVGAAQAVLDGRAIERQVKGVANGSDLSAGFDQEWVQMLELNSLVAAQGTQERIDRLVDQLRRGRLNVFRGDYTGTDPLDAADTVDLKDGYAEYAAASYPAFHYILNDYITILE